MAGSKRHDLQPLILIPAAGDSSRFKAQGYHTPKPFLKIRNAAGVIDYMLGHVLSTLPKDADVRVIIRRGMTLPENSAYDIYFEDHPKPNWTVIEDTDSHPMTIFRGLGYDRRPVLCLDCDMLLHPWDIQAMLQSTYRATVAVGESWNPAMAHVDSVEYPRVFAEAPLSKWGVVSGRMFDNGRLLSDALANVLSQPKDWPAPTMSHVLNLYPGTKKAIVLSEWTDWGTPEAVRQSGAVIL